MTTVPDQEAPIRAAWEAQDLTHAFKLALAAYRNEIETFLTARLRSPDAAIEVYAMFTEDLWRALPSFGWRCNIRSFAYTLARNAACRYARQPDRRAERNIRLSSVASQVVQESPTDTAPYRRTDVKTRIRALRDSLSEEDRTLLLLYIDRNLSWREIAIVMHEEGERAPEAALEREAARLRKRFERVKSSLRVLALRDGLIVPRH